MKLTIVTASKDNYEGLRKTIDSTMRLKKSGFVEHIVVDSSTSGIADKNEALCLSHKLNYVYQKPKGISAAFNLGMKMATGDWIWYLNSGDSLIKNFDESFLWWLLEKSDSDSISFQIIMSKRGKTMPTPVRKMWLPMINWINHPAMIMKTDKLRELGGFDESFQIAMDGELWFRFLAKNGSVDVISVPLVNFEDGGLSSDQSKTAKEIVRVYLKHTWLILKSWGDFGLRIAKGWAIYLVNTIGPRT